MVKKPGIGVVGVSMGADFASYMAIARKQVIACVPINGFFFYATSFHFKNGAQQPTALPDGSEMYKNNDGIYNFSKMYIYPEGCEEAAIPFELAPQCNFLMVCSKADDMVGLYHRDRQVERFQKHGCTNYRVLSLPGAGHLLEPPYTPLSAITYHKVFDVVMTYGGEPVGHAKAQERAWKEIRTFLHQQLDNQQPKHTA